MSIDEHVKAIIRNCLERNAGGQARITNRETRVTRYYCMYASQAESCPYQHGKPEMIAPGLERPQCKYNKKQ